MRITILTILFVLGLFSFCIAQKIEMKTTAMGYKFTQNGDKLSWKELLNVTESNEEAYQLIKKGKSQNIISAIIGFVGGGFIGVPLGKSLTNQDPNWTLA